MTRLCVGAVSRNVVAAAVEEANAQGVEIDIIASRRQVDTDGGYLKWTQYDLVTEVERWDDRKLVRVCRDHGGPHQRERVPPGEALRESLASFSHDRMAGFKGLHIDVCELNLRMAEAADALETYVELLSDLDVRLEIGSERQGSSTTTSRLHMAMTLLQLQSHGLLRDVQYAVVQTGTHVIETRNSEPPDYADLATRAIRMCETHGVQLKEHNGDYLSEQRLRERRRLKVPAINIAPEYGVLETFALLQLLMTAGHYAACQRFMSLAFESKRWEKWRAPNSKLQGSALAVLAGHYIFETDEVHEIKDALGPDTDERLIELLRLRIRRHLEELT